MTGFLRVHLFPPRYNWILLKVTLNTINPATSQPSIHPLSRVHVCFFWGVGVLVVVGCQLSLKTYPYIYSKYETQYPFIHCVIIFFTHSYIQLKHFFPKNTHGHILIFHRIRLSQNLWNYRRICLSDKEAWNVLKRKWWTTIAPIFTKQTITFLLKPSNIKITQTNTGPCLRQTNSNMLLISLSLKF